MSLARRVETGKPSRAYSIAGASSSWRDMVPKRSSASTHAATAPGTETESGPLPGTSSRPRAANSPGVASAPARPLPFSAYTRPVAASWYSAKASPPTPFMWGANDRENTGHRDRCVDGVAASAQHVVSRGGREGVAGRNRTVDPAYFGPVG